MLPDRSRQAGRLKLMAVRRFGFFEPQTELNGGLLASSIKPLCVRQPIEGMIDKKSQRTAWSIEGKQWPIMETGISNLTEDTAPTLIHFEDGQTQQWLLVRLEEPESEAGSN